MTHMKRLRVLLVLATLLASCSTTPAPAFAQGFRVVQPAPDCNLGRRAFDNPFSDTKGYVQPRIAWHVEYAVGTALLTWAIDKATPLPKWASATTATVLVGVVPHARSVFWQRRYPINPGDLAFDLVNRSTPFVMVSSAPARRWLAFSTWLAADALLSCLSSP
jgi:hypothetical protein